MYRYSAYGLEIASEMCIPELEESAEDGSDVMIRHGPVEKPDFDHEDQHSVARRIPEGHVYYIRNIGGVRVEDGDTIIASPLDGAKERGFRFLVSGIGLGMLLHQRGLITLHASAVALQEHVVGFIGPKGMGKSTTAAAFHAHGHPVVTDDLLVLDIADDQITVRPGLPHLKLYPESIKGSLKEDPNRIPKIDPQGSKRSYNTQAERLSASLPLRCLYILDYESDQDGPPLPHSRAMRGDQACVELIRHSYIPRLLPEEALSPQHLKRSAQIARTVPVRRLYREESLDRLSELVSCVEEENMRSGCPKGA
jgi:hypothetical protein